MEDLNELWKDVGRDTEAGKLLYSLYKADPTKKISYPEVKRKSTA